MHTRIPSILERIRWPLVRRTHPNYWTVLMVEVVVHVGLGISSCFGSHPSAVWKYFGGTLGLSLLGAFHILIAGWMVAGLYSYFMFTRIALLFSVTTYLLQACLLTGGIISAHLQGVTTAVEGPIYSFGLIMLSVAAFKEPLVPGRARQGMSR